MDPYLDGTAHAHFWQAPRGAPGQWHPPLRWHRYAPCGLQIQTTTWWGRQTITRPIGPAAPSTIQPRQTRQTDHVACSPNGSTDHMVGTMWRETTPIPGGAPEHHPHHPGLTTKCPTTTRPTTLPRTDPGLGQPFRGSRLCIPNRPKPRSSTRSHDSTAALAWHLATEVRTERNGVCSTRVGATYGAWQLLLSQGLRPSGQSYLCRGSPTWHGGRPTHKTTGSPTMQLQRRRPLPGPPCSHWRRGQDTHHLRRISRWGQHSHPEPDNGEDHSPHGPGLCPSTPLATWGKQLTTTHCPSPAGRTHWSTALAMAKTQTTMVSTQGWRDQGTQTGQSPPARLEIPSSRAGRRMVDQQGRHLRHGKCSTILGQNSSSHFETAVQPLSPGRLGICLCWWLLLASTCQRMQTTKPQQSLPLWLRLEYLWVGRRPTWQRSTLGWALLYTPTFHKFRWSRQNTFLSWKSLSSLSRTQWWQPKPLRRLWDAYNGQQQSAQWPKVSYNHSGLGRWQ